MFFVEQQEALWFDCNGWYRKHRGDQRCKGYDEEGNRRSAKSALGNGDARKTGQETEVGLLRY
jgi:hypothetical protein